MAFFKGLSQWCECWNAEQAAGEREFNAAINGSQVLNTFDVYTHGGLKRATVKQFTVTADSNGQVTIAFTQGAADHPFISGTELYTNEVLVYRRTGREARHVLWLLRCSPGVCPGRESGKVSLFSAAARLFINR